jgi:hypothetical protein
MLLHVPQFRIERIPNSIIEILKDRSNTKYILNSNANTPFQSDLLQKSSALGNIVRSVKPKKGWTLTEAAKTQGLRRSNHRLDTSAHGG